MLKQFGGPTLVLLLLASCVNENKRTLSVTPTESPIVLPTPTTFPTLSSTRVPTFMPLPSSTPFIPIVTQTLTIELGSITPSANVKTTTQAFYRGDVQRTGFYKTREVHQKPQQIWKVKLEQGVCAPPVIADEIAYVSNCNSLLYAIDTRSGATLWTLKTDSDNHNSPSVVNGVVYFTSKDGYLYALDAKTGQQFWRLSDGGIAAGSPAIANGVIFFSAGNDRDVYMSAVDLETRQVKWRSQVLGKSGTDASSFITPAYADGVFYFAGTGFDAETGATVWHSEQGTWEIAVYDGMVYGPDANIFYAFDAKTGQLKWKAQPVTDQPWLTPLSPAVADDVVYAGWRELFAFDARTGELKWRFKGDLPMVAAPTVADGAVYYIGEDDKQTPPSCLYALDAKTGKELWHLNLDLHTTVPPAIADGVLYVAGTVGGDYSQLGDGYVYTFK